MKQHYRWLLILVLLLAAAVISIEINHRWPSDTVGTN